jgi:hypothetical protein
LLGRVAALRLSPFDKTLAFDVDARLRAPRLDQLFALLDQIEIAQAPCNADTSTDHQLYGRPLYNNGIILYRQTPRVRNFLATFEQTYRQHLEAATTAMPDTACVAHIKVGADRQRLLCSDQIAMAQVFSPERNSANVVFATLGDHWNWGGGGATRRPAEAVIIDHRPQLRGNSWPLLAYFAFRTLGNGKLAAPLYSQAINMLAPDLIAKDNAALLKMPEGNDATSEEANRISALDGQPENLESLLRIAVLHTDTLETPALATALMSKIGVS